MSYDIQSKMEDVEHEGVKSTMTIWTVVYWTHVHGPGSPAGFLEVFSSPEQEVAEDFLFAMRIGSAIRREA